MYRSETLTSPSPALQLGTIIAELHRRVHLIEADIRAEEQRSKVFDRSNATYPVLALELRHRRDNLLSTISVLEAQRDPGAA